MKYVEEFYGHYVYEPDFFAKEGREYFIGEVPTGQFGNTVYYIWTNNDSYSLAHKEIKEFLKDDSLTAGQHEQAHLNGDLPTYFQKYHNFKFIEEEGTKYDGYFVYEIVRPYDD